MKKETYIIKIWSNVLMSDNWINENVIKKIVSQVSEMKNKWYNVIIVTSWAVAMWKKILWISELKNMSKLESSQIFSSIWQAELMHIYSKLFEKYSIKISQALLTRRDFENIESYDSVKRVLLTSLSLWIVPIINENDVISQEELSFSDNDELSALLCSMILADNLIILSSIDWFYDNFPSWNLIKEIEKIDENIYSMVWIEKSSMWRWWMESKLNTAKKMMNLWIDVYIANWKIDWVITEIVSWKNPWTLFKAK